MPHRRGALSISDPDAIYAADTYARGVPFDRLARLRAKTPVTWAGDRLGGGPGCWVVLRHADARHVLEHPELFASRFHDDGPHDCDSVPVPPEQLEQAEQLANGACAIDMDPAADALLDRIAGREAADFAGEVTRDLPDMVRNALAGGLYALIRNPEQYARLRRERGDHELVDHAVEEMLRWWSPVLHVRRTVRRRTVLGGVPVRRGEQVAVWLASADHDDAVFPAPDRFDIGRTPNPHLAFGHGLRRCVGAELARTHMRAFVAALARRPGLLELAGEPVRLRSNISNGFKRLPVRLVG